MTLEITPWFDSRISRHRSGRCRCGRDRVQHSVSSAAEIADNKVTAQIRLREGRVDLIGSIISVDELPETSPGFRDLPTYAAGPSVSPDEDTERNKTGLVIALVPHRPRPSWHRISEVLIRKFRPGQVSYDSAKLADGIRARRRQVVLATATPAAASG